MKILTQCKKAIPARKDGGKVIIIDIVIGAPSGPLLEAQLLMDVGMMVATKGRQRDENDCVISSRKQASMTIRL